MSILIQAIKKHIPAVGSLLIIVKGRFSDAIPVPERPIIQRLVFARLVTALFLSPLLDGRAYPLITFLGGEERFAGIFQNVLLAWYLNKAFSDG